MKNLSTLLFPVALSLTTMTMSACVQLPTERAEVADLRPQVSFRVDTGRDDLLAAQVSVDGLPAGRVGDFIEGKAALRVLPGRHLLQVVSATGPVLEQQVYLGDGVSRAFLLK